jgi:hypothetical protein
MVVARIIELDDVRLVIWWCASSIMRCVREITERAAAAFLTPLVVLIVVLIYRCCRQDLCKSSSHLLVFKNFSYCAFFSSPRHDVHRMPAKKRRVGFGGQRKRHDWIGARVEGFRGIHRQIWCHEGTVLISPSTRLCTFLNAIHSRVEDQITKRKNFLSDAEKNEI